jgi:alpha-methylacyl-CoA racemase
MLGRRVHLDRLDRAELLRLTGLAEDPDFAGKQMNKASWPKLKERIGALFLTKSRAEWCEIMEGTDVCFAPVLTMSEAAGHPHNVARETFIEVAGIKQPAPAPRFSRTTPVVESAPAYAGQHTREVLADLGLSVDQVQQLVDSGAVRHAE